MTHTLSASNARAARLRAAMLAVLVALAAAAFATSAAGAASSSSRQPRIAASLEQSPTAVPVDGSLGFTAVIRLPEAASYVQARVQVRRSGGKLVYQRTQTLDNAPAGPTSFTFTRDLAGLDLKPGAYPVRLAVTASLQGSTVETEVASELLVYDADKPAVPVVLVARVTGPPLSDPQGRLVLDPAVETGRREAVERIAAIVLADPDARVTLAVPPLMLEEWRRLTSGYTRADGTAVPASEQLNAAQHSGVERAHPHC